MTRPSRLNVTLFLLAWAVPALSLSPCGEAPQEIPRPGKAQLTEFIRFLNASDHHYELLNPGTVWAASEMTNELCGLFVADVDNDGQDEYLWACQGGTGHYTRIEGIYRKKDKTFVPAPFIPGYENGANEAENFDLGHVTPHLVTKACGTTFLNFVPYEDWKGDKKTPASAFKRYLWSKGSLVRQCDDGILESENAAFKSRYRKKQYGEAYDYLKQVRESCHDTLRGEPLYWVLSDLAVASHHAGKAAECKKAVGEAQNDPDFGKASEKVRKALKTNRELCETKS